MKKSFLILFLGSLLALSFFPLAGSGDIGADRPPEHVVDPSQIILLLEWLLSYMWIIMGIIVVMMLLYAGFQFVTAAGDPEKIEKAKTMVKYSLIGIVVMVLAGGAVTLIDNIIGQAT